MLLWALAVAPVCSPAAAAQLSQAGIPSAAPSVPQRPQVTVAVTGTYDSNVTGLRQVSQSLTPLQPSDEILTPSVTVATGKAFGRQALYLNGSFSYNFYKKNTILNSERFDLGGGARLSLGPCQPSLNAGYSRRESDQEDLLLQVVHNKEIRTSIGAGLSCARAIGFSPVLQVSKQWDHNTNPLRRIIDSESFSVSAGMAYARPSLGSLTVYGSYDRSKYPNRPRLTPTGVVIGDDFDVLAGGVRYSRNLGTRLTADAALSYTHLKSRLPGLGVNKGLGYSIDLTYKATGRIQAHGTFARTQGATNRVNASYVTSKTYGGDLSYQMGPRITLSGGGAYTIRNYSGAGFFQGAVGITHEEITNYYGNVRFALNPKLSLNVNAFHNKRVADAAQFSYSNTRVNVAAVARF